MTTSLRYFMVVVKEQSIVRAAEKLYLTPQNLSNHIKRLERTYGVLFLRHPSFQLTLAGEALYHTLQQIQVLEKSLDTRIQEIKQEKQGTLRFGIHQTRARLLLPPVLKAYEQEYPNIRIHLFYQHMQENEQMLLSGRLDAFLGVDTPILPEFTYIRLGEDPFYFITTRRLLNETRIDPVSPEIKVADLTKFQYLLSPTFSRIRQKLDMFCQTAGIVLDEHMTISDFELQLKLVSNGRFACFCPKIMMPTVDYMNRDLPAECQLVPLKVEQLNLSLNLSLVVHNLAFRSKSLNAFLTIFKQEYDSYLRQY